MKPLRVMGYRAAAGGSSGGGAYVNDYVTPRGAWSSERVLIRGYAGPLIRVRRSSDNAEQDIGASGGMLDTAALLSFAGSGSAYVQTIYEQSGSAGDFAQATTNKQPRIVNAGVIENNFASTDGTQQYMDATISGGLASSAATVFANCKIAPSTYDQYGLAFDLGYNTASATGFALYSDNRSLGSGWPGLVIAMSGAGPGPYVQDAFPDSGRALRSAAHKLCARFNLSATTSGDTALHSYADGSDASRGTNFTGDPSGVFNATTLRFGLDYAGVAPCPTSLRSLVLTAADDLAAQSNVLAVM